jgi:hypothetical protein
MWLKVISCALLGSGSLALCVAGTATARVPGWSIQATPNPTGSFDTGLTDVSCSSTTACTAVGDSFFNSDGPIFPAAPLAERWDGARWSLQAAVDPNRGSSFSESGLSGVSCVSATACTAVGFDDSNNVGAPGGIPLAEQWNGVGWSIQSIPTPIGPPLPTIPGGGPVPESQLNGVSCTSTTACIAVGSFVDSAGRGAPLVERWDGASWSIQTTPTPPGVSDSMLWGVSCASTTACSAVGSSDNRTGTRFTVAEQWDGVRWSIQTTPTSTAATDTNLNAVSCISPTACTAVGTSSGLALAERWNGTRWSIQTTPNIKGAPPLEGVSCSSIDACTAVGSSPTLAERWNGVRWAIQMTPSPVRRIASLSGVSCPSSTVCGAVGDSENHDGDTSVPLAEAWNGTRPQMRAAILSGTAFVSPSGVAGVFLGCFAARPCRGSMTVTHGQDVIAHRNAYTIRAADGGIVHLTVSPSARRALAGGPVAVTVQISDAGDGTGRARVKLVPFGNSATAHVAAVRPSRIVIVGHTGFVSRSGLAAVFLGCFGIQNCTGTISLTKGPTTLASHHGTLVTADSGALVRIALTANGRKLVAEGTAKVKVTIREASGPTATCTLPLEHF